MTGEFSNIPTIDFMQFLKGSEGERKKIASEVDFICQSIGFLIIENHGIKSEVLDTAWQAAEQFFEGPIDDKNTAVSCDPACPRGYFPAEKETLAKTIGVETPPDLKESYSSGPLAAPLGYGTTDDFNFFYGSNIWPKKPHNFQNIWQDYYGEMENFGAQIMQMLGLALGVEEDYFVKYHTHHISALRANSYPPVTKKVTPGQLRAGAHTDYGTVTILNPDPVVGGLEVQTGRDEWISAPRVSDAFIINIGDLMARWTNDRWVSTMHRVVAPEVNVGEQTKRRQSIAYFMNPNFDAEIKVIPTCALKDEGEPYKPVLAGEYLMDKFKISI